MRKETISLNWIRKTGRPQPSRWLLLGLLAALTAPGCHHEEESRYRSVSEPPTVLLRPPPVRDVVHVVNQPSFVEPYERTSIYPKIRAYIQEWKVDIGDKVTKGQPLAYLFVPELVELHGTKQATVGFDSERVELAKKVVKVADADVKAARARLEEAKAELARYEAAVERWDSEVTRLRREVDRGVVNPQVLLESTNQLKASVASRDAAKATVMKAEAELVSREATLSKAKVDVRVAEADLKVADFEERRLKAWVDYLTLPAPFDGVITARNANTWDFVLPAAGDPSADANAPHLSPSKDAAPIYVVDRTDIVRIFIDIPEEVSNYVQVGTDAAVLARGYRDEPIRGKVTRTSWALNVNSRTLRAEIDLTNPEGRLLPGMYAYAQVVVKRPKVLTLPIAAPMHLDDRTFCDVKGCEREHSQTSALMHIGEKTYCWLYRDGKAERVEVRTGVSDGRWIEVTKHQAPSPGGGDEAWVPFEGKEQVILGDLTLLTDGGPVTVAGEEHEPKGAGEAHAHDHAPDGAMPHTPVAAR